MRRDREGAEGWVDDIDIDEEGEDEDPDDVEGTLSCDSRSPKKNKKFANGTLGVSVPSVILYDPLVL